MNVGQSSERDGHSKEDEKERSDDKGTFQSEQMIVAVQIMHAVIVEEPFWPRTSGSVWFENIQFRKKQAVVVQHQTKNQNQHQRAEVK